MPRRKIRDADDADAQLAAARAAGLSNRDWAAKNGICGRSLHLWSVHRRRSPRSSTPPIVELVAPAQVPVGRPAGMPKADTPLRLHLGGVTIDIPVGFDLETLAQVLDVVRAC